MQSVKVEFLTRYNDLVSTAISKKDTFPDNLCEFLAGEYEFQAVVLFSMEDDGNFKTAGKAGSVKKSFENNSVAECPLCRQLAKEGNKVKFDIHADCQINVSDYMIYEGSLFIKVSDSEKYLLKFAKKTPFVNSDISQIETIGGSISSLLNIWTGGKSTGASLSSIVSEIAHELRTPTNSIMGFASLLNEDNLSVSQSEYVATLKDSAYNLLSLLNDLIDLAKIEAGVIKPSASSIHIRNFAEEVVKIFTDKINKNKVEILLNVESNIPETLKTDAQKVRTILSNILTYSARATEKGKISVAISLSGNKLNFKITDTSPGISSAKLKESFKPFSLFDGGINKTGSATGLGLILSRKLAEMLNGDVEITSNVGKGTSYSFSVLAGVPSSVESQLSALPKPGKKNKVLVVEDDYATSKLLSNYLNKWGYEPTIVNSAGQALKAIEKDVYLAVLMDIVLPDANGFELLKSIREHKNTRNTPVIVCSVEAEQQKAFLMGAVEYFVKPIKYKYLVEVLTSYKLKKDSNILVVDDDVPTLNLIKGAVEQAGYNAVAEPKSAKVIERIENMHIDLAIVDLDMPEVNGFQLIKSIKSLPQFAKLPIIIYTGKENYQDDLKKIDGMFADLLHKSSSNIEDLADTINEMINRYDEPSTPEEVSAQKDVIKILLVEDYKHSQIIVTRLLKKNNFESIVVVENGAEALEQVKKQSFDLILMDMQMPVMNGFEATERIRQMPEYKETPIIALTAFAMKGDREKCLEAGATDYIPKPIDSQEFIEKVKFYTESKVNAD